MLQIRCKNNNQTRNIAEGSSLLEIYNDFGVSMKYPPISAKVNNVSQGLKFRLFQNRDIEYVSIQSPSGMRVYIRSLCFVLCKAVQDIYPHSRLYIEHPISRGFYCNFVKPAIDGRTRGLTALEIEQVRLRMKEIISQDLPFRRHEVPTEDAIALFRSHGMADKVKLLETLGKPYTDYYILDETIDYYYGALLPSTGYIHLFSLEPYGDGMLLRVPDRDNPSILAEKIAQPMTFQAYKEQVRWNVIMRLSNAGDVNKACEQGRATELIQVSEALQEKKIVQIAEEIYRRHQNNGLRIVLITGPSSSGKTTFTKRLSVQLLACGICPISFSTDDYFVNRVDTPLLPDGQYDFDNFDTVDHALLRKDLSRLLQGEEVSVPEYNFTTGMREYNGKRLSLSDNKVLIIEGIHALNPLLTDSIPDTQKYRIYTSVLTSVSLDSHNWVPTRDNRLLRRIIRDYNKQAFTAQETIRQWKNVCQSEERWILPYQENADAMFNSALNIEFAVLRSHAEPILATVPKNCPEYAEAHRLLKFIHYFTPISHKDIPPTSIMREFVGGSSFKY